ncbi:hypothetical protein SL053_002234, partial [Flavobacterium psychrophilum]|nr:hypothetical protein [Flavobacterium psychrophilum]
MVTESQFVKHAIKENDTLTSVANDFDVSIEYLILVHNLHVENYDKIKNRLNFPEHLKEIYIHQDTAAAFVQKKNKERTKNNPDLIYKHILAEKKYQVLYSFLDGDEETNLSFQTSITTLKKSSNQPGFVVEINRTEPTLINNALPDLVIDELAVET